MCGVCPRARKRALLCYVLLLFSFPLTCLAQYTSTIPLVENGSPDYSSAHAINDSKNAVGHWATPELIEQPLVANYPGNPPYTYSDVAVEQLNSDENARLSDLSNSDDAVGYTYANGSKVATPFTSALVGDLVSTPSSLPIISGAIGALPKSISGDGMVIGGLSQFEVHQHNGESFLRTEAGLWIDREVVDLNAQLADLYANGEVDDLIELDEVRDVAALPDGSYRLVGSHRTSPFVIAITVTRAVLVDIDSNGQVTQVIYSVDNPQDPEDEDDPALTLPENARIDDGVSLALSPDGALVMSPPKFGAIQPAGHGILRTPDGTVIYLPPAPGYSEVVPTALARASDLDDPPEYVVVGYMTGINVPQRAFVWTAAMATVSKLNDYLLDTQFYEIREATDINSDGWITANGIRTTDNSPLGVVIPPPQPLPGVPPTPMSFAGGPPAVVAVAATGATTSPPTCRGIYDLAHQYAIEGGISQTELLRVQEECSQGELEDTCSPSSTEPLTLGQQIVGIIADAFSAAISDTPSNLSEVQTDQFIAECAKVVSSDIQAWESAAIQNQVRTDKSHTTQSKGVSADGFTR